MGNCAIPGSLVPSYPPSPVSFQTKNFQELVLAIASFTFFSSASTTF